MGIDKILTSFWLTYPFLQQKDQIYIIGVSGGVDSIVLVHGLLQSQLVQPHQLVVAYINHGLRPEAYAEEAFIQKQANAWGTKVEIGRVDSAKEYNQLEKIDSSISFSISSPSSFSSFSSIEEQARDARYNLLAQIAQQYESSLVLVAHHADDQAETLLLNLIRGSGLAGLSGMQPISAYPLNRFSQLKLVRPLLNTTRSEIARYAKTQHLVSVYDQSNDNWAFTRNRVRQQLIPILESYNPEVRQALSRTADILAGDYQVLTRYITEIWEEVRIAYGVGWLRFSLSKWIDQPKGVQRALLRQIMLDICGHTQNLSYSMVDQAIMILKKQQTGHIVQLSPHVELNVHNGQVVAVEKTNRERLLQIAWGQPQLSDANMAPISFSSPYRLANGWVLLVQPIGYDDIVWDRVKRDPRQAVIQVPPDSHLGLRGRRIGELFEPLGINGSKKLKDWMIDRKIPAILRNKWPLLVSRETDEILWVIGHRISQRAAVVDKTKPLIYLQLLDPQQQSKHES